MRQKLFNCYWPTTILRCAIFSCFKIQIVFLALSAAVSFELQLQIFSYILMKINVHDKTNNSFLTVSCYFCHVHLNG